MNEILKCREFASNAEYLIREFEIYWAQNVQDKDFPVTQDSMGEWWDQFNSWLSLR